MARPKSKDKEITISVKISEQLKNSLSILAELQEIELSGYIRQVLQQNADQNAELTQKALALKQKYAAEKSKLVADTKFDFAQDSKGSDG